MRLVSVARAVGHVLRLGQHDGGPHTLAGETSERADAIGIAADHHRTGTRHRGASARARQAVTTSTIAPAATRPLASSAVARPAPPPSGGYSYFNSRTRIEARARENNSGWSARKCAVSR